jgi:hypothetical protein
MSSGNCTVFLLALAARAGIISSCVIDDSKTYGLFKGVDE